MGGNSRGAARAANVLLALAGAALLLLALRMGEGWAARHFLPAWAYGWDVQLRILLALRLTVAASGLAVLLLLRPWLVRAFRAGRGRQALVALLTSSLAVILSLAATEGVLRTRTWRSVQERWDQEPKRVRDAEYGWAFAPDHEGTVQLNGKTVHYATGPYGYRAPRAGVAPDFAKPTIVFAGESVVFGYGLDFADTLPAQVAAMTGLQAANMGVNAHSTDQTYLRLRRELPRFQRPVAVVIPFMSILFDRNLDRDRPHLDSGLRWHAAGKPPLRLVELARRVTRYRGLAAIDEGKAMTRAALRASLALAQARGAKGIILVPQYLPESAQERAVRRMVLDEGRIPYVLVPLRPEWRSPGHGHPNPRGAKALAEAVVGAIGGKPAAQPQ